LKDPSGNWTQNSYSSYRISASYYSLFTSRIWYSAVYRNFTVLVTKFSPHFAALKCVPIVLVIGTTPVKLAVISVGYLENVEEMDKL